MLQALREKMTGWVALLVIGLLIIPFAFFGIDQYFTGLRETWVAKVGDREIGSRGRCGSGSRTCAARCAVCSATPSIRACSSGPSSSARCWSG
ncbi:MAG: SurA N-terminal domain-containing protein [Xanthomonadales bacterium]|nr:SurA N-terminal domain-containing protein [Xanthomonadales bacterium]